MNRLFITLIFLISINTVQAQYFHLTLFGGTSNYQGDLQDKKFTFQQSHAAFGAGVIYEITDNLFARANFTTGTISGDDKQSEKNRIRNLNFTSKLTEIHLGIEYLLVNLYNHKLAPYIFTGISGYHFNPYTTATGSSTKVYLQPLGTEGQGFYKGKKKYNLNQIAIPFGGGIKFAVNDNLRLGLEIGLRKLLTDYIDDVSTDYVPQALLLSNNGQQAVDFAFRGDEITPARPYPTTSLTRGNPKSKDWYYFSGITLSYRIDPSELKDRNKNNKAGCPRL
ncbi:DUF6089 family protein [Ferruginibacter lapsinanis]|uniref:DUF6089 family protein n=1 Tax=Ferruginibacter lapsinanis TaxID=563172 RepID=UPI001E44B796|nr:DUF6089 family protein [Ferruginibacter lapsinanis]UEG49388.1 DUF6089 family protein [Ferruginibacter lapsinanis]